MDKKVINDYFFTFWPSIQFSLSKIFFFVIHTAIIDKHILFHLCPYSRNLFIEDMFSNLDFLCEYIHLLSAHWNHASAPYPPSNIWFSFFFSFIVFPIFYDSITFKGWSDCLFFAPLHPHTQHTAAHMLLLLLRRQLLKFW